MIKKLTQNEVVCHLSLPIFDIISQEADNLQRECYVVGGYVRDLYLGCPSKDIDCVIVGSGIELAEKVAKHINNLAAAHKSSRAHLSVFRNFGTAQVKYFDKKYGTIEVEFVGARKESYSHDSRKPIVEDGTLQDDQNRRDLTINDMAICLNRKTQNIINSCAIQKGQADEYIYMDSPESAFVLGIGLLADPESVCYLLLGEAVQFPQAYDPFENAGRTAKISSG